MDMTAEGCASMRRLISEMLRPFSLLSSRLTNCANISLPKSQQQTALIDHKGNDPCHGSLVEGRGHRPGGAKFMFDRSQRGDTWHVEQHEDKQGYGTQSGKTLLQGRAECCVLRLCLIPYHVHAGNDAHKDFGGADSCIHKSFGNEDNIFFQRGWLDSLTTSIA